MNMGKIAADIFLAVAIFLTLIFGSMLYFTGNTKYRVSEVSVRHFAHLQLGT